MKTVSDNFFNKNKITLTDDILIPECFESVTDFSGTIYGNNYCIYCEKSPIFTKINNNGLIQNVTIKLNNSVENCILAKENNGLLKNIKIKNVHIKRKTSQPFVSATKTNTGGLVRNNGGIIENCTVIGVINGCSQTGGICGRNNETGMIRNCTFIGEIEGRSKIGGLIGINIGTLCNSNCNVYISDSSCNQIGGLIGSNCSGIIKKSISKGKINGEEKIGGIVGEDIDGNCTNSYSTISIEGEENVGLLIGSTYNSIVERLFTLNTSAKCDLIGSTDEHSKYNHMCQSDVTEKNIKSVLL